MASWPEEVCSDIKAQYSNLIAEENAQRKYLHSFDHYVKPPPPTPHTLKVYETIDEAMKDRELRVFHATRLLDFREIKREGLHLLVLQERISRLKELTSGLLSAFKDQIDTILSRIDLTDSYFTDREGFIWAVPMRKFLHDGGSNVFFEHWGGEVIQRLASEASPELEQAIRSIGEPAVVMIRIPAIGFCQFSKKQLPLTMLKIALEQFSGIKEGGGRDVRCIQAWDVCCPRAIPPEWIEDVVFPSDPKVAYCKRRKKRIWNTGGCS